MLSTQTQSPTLIAGLRRIATSLWLHFVALPQRVPVHQHRRLGGTVVIFFYRTPPLKRIASEKLDGSAIH
jgi:hypothetical protein